MDGNPLEMSISPNKRNRFKKLIKETDLTGSSMKAEDLNSSFHHGAQDKI